MKKKLIIAVVLLLAVGLGVGYYLSDGELFQGRFGRFMKLSVSVASDTPAEDIIVAGSEDVEVAKFKFTSTGGAFAIMELKVLMDTDSDGIADLDGSSDNNISKITLSYENIGGDTETKEGYIASGEALFVGMDLHVPAGGSSYLYVYADLNSIDMGATSGEQFAVGIGEGVAMSGKSSKVAIDSRSVFGNTMHLHESKPTLELSSSSPSGSRSVSATDEPFIFTVTAHDEEDIYLEELTINMQSDGDFADLPEPYEFDALEVYLMEGSTEVASGAVNVIDSNNAYVTLAPGEFDSELEITKGTTSEFTLRVDTTTLLDEDSGVDDPLTFSIDYGSASSGVVTPGDFTWSETNETVQWCGDVDSSYLRSNTVNY